jgi:hypothetical protein
VRYCPIVTRKTRVDHNLTARSRRCRFAAGLLPAAAGVYKGAPSAPGRARLRPPQMPQCQREPRAPARRGALRRPLWTTRPTSPASPTRPHAGPHESAAAPASDGGAARGARRLPRPSAPGARARRASGRWRGARGACETGFAGCVAEASSRRRCRRRSFTLRSARVPRHAFCTTLLAPKKMRWTLSARTASRCTIWCERYRPWIAMAATRRSASATASRQLKTKYHEKKGVSIGMSHK